MNLIRTGVSCGACGGKSEQTLSPAEPDPRLLPDLDSRPHGAIRSTVAFWIQRCPHCGYCAADIANIHEKAIDLVQSADYQRALTDERFPSKVREFLCHARICAQAGQPADAGWCCLHAAWLCDDSADSEAGVRCRELALDYWKQAKLQGEDFGEGGMEYVLVVDLLRKMGRFEDALVNCSQTLDSHDELDSPLPPLVEHILRFEKTLVQKRDTGTYRISDLPAFRNRAV